MKTSALTKTLAIPVLLVALSACAAIEGRETSGQYVDDTTITAKVKEAYVGDPQVKAMEVNVETMQGVVQLSGFVDSPTIEQRAVQLAQQVNGVKSVNDNIIVRKHHRKTQPTVNQ